MNSKIPKRIIQTGKSLDLPLLSKAAMANLKLLNPDFEYLFFDNQGVEDFIAKQFPEYRSVFDGFKKPMYNIAQKYDFFRYLAVYYFGGFYFDLDVLFASGLTDLLNWECVFSFEELTISMYLRQRYNIDWEIGNYAFGAAPGHPFIYAIIQNCIKAQENPKWPEEMAKAIPRLFRRDFYGYNSTGPGLVTRTLVENPDLGQKIKILFPDNVCDSAQWNRFGSFGVHLMEGTWRHKNILRRRLTNLWQSWTRKRLLTESLRLGSGRSLDLKK
jgi:hypothetical protein